MKGKVPQIDLSLPLTKSSKMASSIKPLFNDHIKKTMDFVGCLPEPVISLSGRYRRVQSMAHNTEIAWFSIFVVINPAVATAEVGPPVLPGTVYPIAEVFGKGYHPK
jgi:hypothetical protein